jgi:predicted metal-dependent peptidase
MPDQQTNRTIAGHLRFARAYTAGQLPWFAPALFRCRIIITPRVEVAAIDLHYNVYWNPDVVADIWAKHPREQALAELGFLWVHEISHRLRQHAERAKDKGLQGPNSARLWNIAADFEINDAAWGGLSMPADYHGLLPREHDLKAGQLAEYYYKEVLRRFPNLALPHDDGSGAHGEARDWETGARQNISTLDDQVLRRDAAQRMRQAGDKAMPGNWRDWSDNILTPKVNWRQSLSHRMSIAIQNGLGSRIDYSFQRPSRRQSVYHPILTPSLRGDYTARIAIVVDTSGSMGPDLLLRALTEVAAVLRTFQYPVTIIPCDAEAYEPVKLTAATEAFSIKQLEGGGGTDMRAGIEAALALIPPPDSVLVLTDGMTPYPRERYRTPVIFGIFDLDNTYYQKPPNPPWGKDTVVLISEL